MFQTIHYPSRTSYPSSTLIPTAFLAQNHNPKRQSRFLMQDVQRRSNTGTGPLPARNPNRVDDNGVRLKQIARHLEPENLVYGQVQPQLVAESPGLFVLP